MDAHGIARQVLSASDPGVDFLAGEAAAGLARERNDYLAGVAASHPDRFSGPAVVSGNDPEAALSEIARARETRDSQARAALELRRQLSR